MRPNLTAVFPGTFDPITLGHEDMLQRAAQMFERVILAVAAGHHKKTLFSLQERLDMAGTALAGLPTVEVREFHGLLRDFVQLHQARVLVRGVRSATDFDYEMQLAGMNRQLMPDVETVFLPPGDKYQFISSTLVREIATLGGAVDNFVSPTVNQRLLNKVHRTV